MYFFFSTEVDNFFINTVILFQISAISDITSSDPSAPKNYYMR